MSLRLKFLTNKTNMTKAEYIKLIKECSSKISREELIVDYIKTNPGITRNAVMKHFKESQREMSIYHSINDLVKDGAIREVYERRYNKLKLFLNGNKELKK